MTNDHNDDDNDDDDDGEARCDSASEVSMVLTGPSCPCRQPILLKSAPNVIKVGRVVTSHWLYGRDRDINLNMEKTSFTPIKLSIFYLIYSCYEFSHFLQLVIDQPSCSSMKCGADFKYPLFTCKGPTLGSFTWLIVSANQNIKTSTF